MTDKGEVKNDLLKDKPESKDEFISDDLPF